MDYLAAIEAHFARVRGGGFSLSARDVDLAMKWEALGIPIDVVLRAFAEADSRRRGDPPRTLAVYGRAVARAFALARQLRVGAAPE